MNLQASGQSYTIQTIAGGALPNNIPATSAILGQINGVAVDAGGNVFLTSGTYNSVFRVEAGTGMLTIIAGNGIAGYGGDDGPALNAEMNYPDGVAVDSADNVYVADVLNNRIRKNLGRQDHNHCR